MGVTDVVTNKNNENTIVEAPAFTLTKVLATAAAIVAPIVTLLANDLTKMNFTEWNWVALIIGILGFLAIAGSADVLGRSIATSGEQRAKAESAGRAHLVTFEHPLPGSRAVAKPDPGHDVKVKVLAVAGGADPHFLVKEGDEIKWVEGAAIKVGEKED